MHKSTQLTNMRSRKSPGRSGVPGGEFGPFRGLACDADGTLTWRHHLAARTAAALVRWREAGGRMILVTGELRDDLLHFARTGLFDRIIGENGGTILRPPDWREQRLGPPPPAAAVRRLRPVVQPLRVGRVVVSTQKDQEQELRRAVGRSRQLIRNGKDVMALPPGINKASGLLRALKDLGLSPGEVVGVGNGTNDLGLILACGLRIAVRNAEPDLKREADWVTTGRGPDGVIELIRRLLAGDPPRPRHRFRTKG